jgi:hypothetical protein
VVNKLSATEERELENFLYQFPGPYAMFCAYLDESGTHDRYGLMSVAGVFYDTKSRNHLNRRWKKELERAGIRYFHTVEQAHLRGEFANKTRQEADQLYQKVLAILKQHARGSVAICSIPWGDFDIFRSRSLPYSQYTICTYICMSMLLLTAKHLGHSEVAFSIEIGPNMGELSNLIERQREEERIWGMVRSHAPKGLPHRPTRIAIQIADSFCELISKNVRRLDCRNIVFFVELISSRIVLRISLLL